MTAITTWPLQAESWLDERGKAAWIAAIVLGFIAFWPIGLGLLMYALFFKRNRMGCTGRGLRLRRSYPSSGNSAFDAYKADTLRRLEEEQEAFAAFLKRLREARDKAEFDQFMEDRTRRASPAPTNGE